MCTKSPPKKTKKKNTAGTYRKILSFFHPNDSARGPSRKDFKINKILGTPCSSWKLFIIKQFWTYADHTPEILHGCQKNTIFQRSHLFQTISKHRDASLAPQLKKLNSISIFLGKPHPNHTTLSHHGCGKLPIWRLNSSSKSLFSTSIN